jgi:phosphoribosylanthranilate isomerase
MSLWVKICGNTSLADARLAVDAGADAVGFVFAPSPRQVTVSEAATITARLPETIEKIGVFVDELVEEVYFAVRSAGLTGVQLHFEAEPDLPARLHERLGPKLRILRVVHFDAAAPERVAAQIAAHARDPHVDAVLVDSRTANAVGGSGVSFDWEAARETVFKESGPLKLVAAGGLGPLNVAKAIATLQPWGVDVVSGVEAMRGRKDPFKVRDFVARVRATELQLKK